MKRKELEVLKLINNNPNWEEILTKEPYNLIIKHKEPFVLLKYSQYVSDMSNPIVQECRGLILKKDNIVLTSNPPIQQYKVASMRFSKFFNYGQEEAITLDFKNPVEVSEKIDGSLIGVWYDEDTGWHVSTSGNIDADDSPIERNDIINYRHLFDLAWDDLSFDVLDKQCTYIFELVSQFTRLVVPYRDTKLYLLAIRNNKTLEEFDRNFLPFLSKQLFGDKILIPKTYYCNSIDEIYDSVRNMDENNQNFEGVVLCDNKFNRIKLKSNRYMELFNVRGEGILSDKKILQMVLDETEDDILAFFPEYKPDFDRIRRGLSILITNIKNDLSSIEAYINEDKKIFAEKAKKSIMSDVLFKALSNNYWDKDNEQKAEWLQEYFKNISISKLLDKIRGEINEISSDNAR